MQSMRKHMHSGHASQLTIFSALLIFSEVEDCVRGQGVNATARRFSGYAYAYEEHA